MNSNKGYTMLGWVVWQIGRRAVKRKVTGKVTKDHSNRSKLIAACAVAGVIAVGIALAGRGGSSDE